MGFGSGFRDSGLGLRVWDSVYGSGIRDSGLWCGIQFMVSGFGFRISRHYSFRDSVLGFGIRSRASGLGFRNSGSGFYGIFPLQRLQLLCQRLKRTPSSKSQFYSKSQFIAKHVESGGFPPQKNGVVMNRMIRALLHSAIEWFDRSCIE